jgi:peptide/nickel transport system substrate-binding protein
MPDKRQLKFSDCFLILRSLARLVVGMKLRMVLALAATAAALLAAGCGSGPVGPSNPGASSTIPLLRIGEAFAVPNLDVAKPVDPYAITQLGLETLLKFSPQGQLEPNLAASWAQTSPVTWVYRLRHGVRFWDGHPLTAADVAYSGNYLRAPSSADAIFFPTVKSITAAGPYTVVVTLTHQDASWQDVPATVGWPIFEKSFAEAHKGTLGNPGVLIEGTGPWEIDSLDPTKGAALSANPHWWGGRVPIQRIAVTFFATQTSEELAFRAGEIDMDQLVEDPRSFAATSGAKILSAPACGGALFSMNTLDAPWNDVHVRRAVAYVLNRSDIIAAGGSPANPVYTLIPPSGLRSIASPAQVSALLGSIPLYQHDVAKARQEMARSGYPHGFSTVLQEYTGLGQAVDQSQVIAAELRQIGINAQIKSNSLAGWGALATGPTAKRPTSFFAYGCLTPDVSGGFSSFLGRWNLRQGQQNTAGYAPADVDTLINAGIASTDPARRFAAYSRLLQRLASDVPYVPLYVADENTALSSRFTYPGLSYYTVQQGPYALNIKAA